MMRLALRAALTLFLLAMFMSAGCSRSVDTGLTTSGTIQATEVSVAPEVPGKITAVLVSEGQKVKTGDAVARLDTAALELQLRQAQAGLQGADARLAEARAGSRPEQIRQADELARQVAAALSGAQKNYDTVRHLFDQGAVPRTQLDAATTQVETTSAQVAAARAQADLVRQGATPEQIRQLAAAVAQSRAAVDIAQLNLDRATVKAPVAGVVVRRLLEPGTLISAGAAVATLANLDDLWLRVYVPENQLNRVKLGQTVNVQVDAFPDRTFMAEVVHISDQAEFTPRNVQTKEERATTVYAVKMQLREGLTGELKPGMPADVVLLG